MENNWIGTLGTVASIILFIMGVVGTILTVRSRVQFTNNFMIQAISKCIWWLIIGLFFLLISLNKINALVGAVVIMAVTLVKIVLNVLVHYKNKGERFNRAC
jgi:uncharacterized membrane protein